MEIQRRVFMKWLMAQAVLVVAMRESSAQDEPRQRLGLSILQGATDENQTQFSILHNRDQTLDVYVSESGDRRIFPDRMEALSNQRHSDRITKVFFRNLEPRTEYSLHLFDKLSGKQLDQREFQTLDTQKENLRFALCSCMDESEHEPGIWKTLVQNRPDVIFFIGDSVYADSGAPRTGASPDHLWKRFCDSRRKLEIYFSKRLIPILATWDDHDFGLNDADCHQYAFVKESQANFLSFFAQDPDYCRLLRRGPGVSSAFGFGSQLFVMMDDRSYREAKGSRDRFAHWGEIQESWMMQTVRNHRGPTWLINGTQIFPTMPFKESLSSDHVQQFQGMLKEFRGIESKVIFVSGDVHYSEVSLIEKEALGYSTVEITSSSMHSKNFPGVPDIIPNKRRIAGCGQRNYILVNSVTSGNGARFTATSFGSRREVIFQKQFNV